MTVPRFEEYDFDNCEKWKQYLSRVYISTDDRNYAVAVEKLKRKFYATVNPEASFSSSGSSSNFSSSTSSSSAYRRHPNDPDVEILNDRQETQAKPSSQDSSARSSRPESRPFPTSRAPLQLTTLQKVWIVSTFIASVTGMVWFLLSALWFLNYFLPPALVDPSLWSLLSIAASICTFLVCTYTTMGKPIMNRLYLSCLLYQESFQYAIICISVIFAPASQALQCAIILTLTCNMLTFLAKITPYLSPSVQKRISTMQLNERTFNDILSKVALLEIAQVPLWLLSIVYLPFHSYVYLLFSSFYLLQFLSVRGASSPHSSSWGRYLEQRTASLRGTAVGPAYNWFVNYVHRSVNSHASNLQQVNAVLASPQRFNTPYQ